MVEFRQALLRRARSFRYRGHTLIAIVLAWSTNCAAQSKDPLSLYGTSLKEIELLSSVAELELVQMQLERTERHSKEAAEHCAAVGKYVGFLEAAVDRWKILFAESLGQRKSEYI